MAPWTTSPQPRMTDEINVTLGANGHWLETWRRAYSTATLALSFWGAVHDINMAVKVTVRLLKSTQIQFQENMS